MVVVDSSALLPLARIGRLHLISASFAEILTVRGVREEVLTQGKRGTAKLKDFMGDITIRETPVEAADVAELEGIAVTDASVILVAEENDEVLLANDTALMRVARSQAGSCRRDSTLLLELIGMGVYGSIKPGSSQLAPVC